MGRFLNTVISMQSCMSRLSISWSSFFCPLHIYLHVFCKTLQFAFDNLIRHVCASLNKAASGKKKIVIWRKFIDISGEVTIYMQSFIFKIFHLNMIQKLSFAKCVL